MAIKQNTTSLQNILTTVNNLPSKDVLIEKSITANGTYSASDDNADGYSGVTVNVSPSASFTGYSSPIPNADIRDAAYGNGLFVVIGALNIMYSSDGINWTNKLVPSGVGALQAVTYGNGMFVAIPSNGYSVGAYSYDGINWSTMTMPHSDFWAIGYGEGKFVALPRNSTRAAYSTDGIHWTETTVGSGYWFDVAYGNGMFVGTGTWGSYDAVYSTDGITWNNSDLRNKGLGCVAYGNNTFAAVCYNNAAKNVAYYSTDGAHWIETSLPFSANWYGITYGNGMFIATATNTNKAACSKDGINWTQINMPGTKQWRPAVYGDGKFVVAGHLSSLVACCDVRTNIV